MLKMGDDDMRRILEGWPNWAPAPPSVPALYPTTPTHLQAGTPVTDVQLASLEITRLRAPYGTLRVPFSPVLMVVRPPEPAAIRAALAQAELAFMDEMTIRVPAPGHVPDEHPPPGDYLTINLLDTMPRPP